MESNASTNEHEAARGKFLRGESGGHLLIKLLQMKGVDFVFGTTGSGMPEIQDAMVIEKPPKWIQGLHEFPTVNAAAGYALASERPGVALIDRIVGIQNSLGAVYGAYLNSAPLIILASENVPGISIQSGDPQLHYGSSILSMNSIWTKWNSRLNSLDAIGKEVDLLFHHSFSEPQGPVMLTLRQDLMASEHKSEVPAPTEMMEQHFRVPEDETCRRIFDEILASENPSIATSHLGRHGSFVPPLISLAGLLGIGVFEKRFFMNFPLENPLHRGMLHRYSEPDLGDRSDFLLLLDIGLLPHQSFGNVARIIEISGSEFNRNYVYAGGDYGSALQNTIISGNFDSGPTLRKLHKLASDLIGSREREAIDDRTTRISEEHRRMITEIDAISERHCERGILSGYSVGRIMNSCWENDFTWINGTATFSDQLIKTLRVSEPGTYFGNPSGHLGTTVGMAYGAALARKSYGNIKDHGTFKSGEFLGKNSPIICTTGDGDAIFGNIDSALWSCSHYGLGVVYVIMNNEFWQAEYPPFEKTKYRRAISADDFEFMDLRDPSIEFSKIADAFSVKSRKVARVEEFEDAFANGLKVAKSGRPFLIDVKVQDTEGRKNSTVV